MKPLTRLSIIVFCFFAAIACYVFGAPAGGAIFLFLGIIFEGFFWTAIFKRNKAS